MPRLTLPPEVERFLSQARPAVVATLRSDGAPVTAATEYDWRDGRILLIMDAAGMRVRHLRRDPRCAFTVLGDDWYTHVSLSGSAVEIRDDVDFAAADRIAMRYQGGPYSRRDVPTISVVVELDRWHGWGDPVAG
ncbi:MAG: pyridoxamine 5'-phosphate oxidase family protein [Acidimicrobiia bacterium]